MDAYLFTQMLSDKKVTNLNSLLISSVLSHQYNSNELI